MNVNSKLCILKLDYGVLFMHPLNILDL